MTTTWYKRASTGWAAFAAALAALAVVLGNLTAVYNFVDRLRTQPALHLKLTDLRVEGTSPSIITTFTINKNIQAVGHNCFASLDTVSYYMKMPSSTNGSVKFELPRNVESDRRTFVFEASDLAGPMSVRVTCDGAVSEQLAFTK